MNNTELIEIKCSKAQFDRIIANLTTTGCLINNRCVLGKSKYTCPAINGKEHLLNCPQCLKRNIKHIGKDKN